MWMHRPPFKVINSLAVLFEYQRAGLRALFPLTSAIQIGGFQMCGEHISISINQGTFPSLGCGTGGCLGLALRRPLVSQLPRAALQSSSAFPNSFLASVGEHAARIKHKNRRAGTFLLFIMSLYISFSFLEAGARPSSPSVENNRRFPRRIPDVPVVCPVCDQPPPDRPRLPPTSITSRSRVGQWRPHGAASVPPADDGVFQSAVGLLPSPWAVHSNPSKRARGSEMLVRSSLRGDLPDRSRTAAGCISA